MLIYGSMRTTHIQIKAKLGDDRVLLIQTIVRLAWLAAIYTFILKHRRSKCLKKPLKVVYSDFGREQQNL